VAVAQCSIATYIAHWIWMLIFGYGQVSMTYTILKSIGRRQGSASHDQCMVKAVFVFLILTSQLSEVDAADRQTNSRATYEAIATTAATLQAVRAIINRGWGTSDFVRLDTY